MIDSSQSHSRTVGIFKNSAFLYVRMLFTIVMGFYTSRVVLEALGVTDYGIYALIGGLVVMFNFLNESLVGTVKRFVSIGIGRKDPYYTRKVFNVGLVTNIVISCFIFILLETGMYWYMCHKLNIPEASMSAAKCVFHLSSLKVAINILQVPYSSLVVAHEKMDFFALTTIADTLSKLLIVISLLYIATDKLILYAALLMIVAIPMLLWHIAYCKRHFANEMKFELVRDWSIYKEIFSFSWWSMIGGLSSILNKQGINIILNIFGGVVVNAAMGVVNQASSLIYQFAMSVQTAFGPPITKAFAADEKDFMRNLLSRSCRCSLYMLILIAVPIGCNVSGVLHLWLGDNVPPHTGYFLIITLVGLIFECVGSPVYHAIASTGKIRNYQLIGNLIILSVLPIGYFALSNGAPVSTLLWISTAVITINFLYRIFYSKNLNLFSLKFAFKDILCPVIIVSSVSAIIGLVTASLFVSDSFLSILSCCALIFITTAIIVYLLGLTKEERNFVTSKIKLKVCN